MHGERAHVFVPGGRPACTGESFARGGVQMPKARYEGIYRELRDRIQGGLYAYRDLLPTEKELTTEFSCSRNTLRRALSMLADEAFVQPIHGKGVRVIWREETHNVTGVLEGIESFGE